MSLSYFIGVIHILTLGIGFYSIWSRGNALKRLTDSSDLKAVLQADNIWGLAAVLWIATGLWRAFGGLEKGSDYYLHSNAFIAKMVVFGIVFMLEIKPMVTLIKWRIQIAKKQPVNISSARLLATLSYVELSLLAVIIALASAMARGIGY